MMRKNEHNENREDRRDATIASERCGHRRAWPSCYGSAEFDDT